MANNKSKKTLKPSKNGGPFHVFRNESSGDVKVIHEDGIILFNEFHPESGNYASVSTHATREEAESSILKSDESEQ